MTTSAACVGIGKCPVPELSRSVFVIPAEHYKGKHPHVQILNDVAWRVVQECRGIHGEYVFVYRRERVKNVDEEPVMPYDRIDTMNNTGYQTARAAAGLAGVRIHDLRHTFGQRLREAGVPQEDRALFLAMPWKAWLSTTPLRQLRDLSICELGDTDPLIAPRSCV